MSNLVASLRGGAALVLAKKGLALNSFYSNINQSKNASSVIVQRYSIKIY